MEGRAGERGQVTGVVTEGEATMQPEVDGLERCYKDRSQGLAEMGEGRGQRLAQVMV